MNIELADYQIDAYVGIRNGKPVLLIDAGEIEDAIADILFDHTADEDNASILVTGIGAVEAVDGSTFQATLTLDEPGATAWAAAFPQRPAS